MFYVCVTCCYLDVTKRRGETAREKARGISNGLSQTPSTVYIVNASNTNLSSYNIKQSKNPK